MYVKLMAFKGGGFNLIFLRVMVFELGPDMVYRDPRGHFRPHLGREKFSEVGVADHAHF